MFHIDYIDLKAFKTVLSIVNNPEQTDHKQQTMGQWAN